MKRYISKFKESKFRIEELDSTAFNTFVEENLKIGDILPLFHYKTKKELLCKVVDIQLKDVS